LIWFESVLLRDGKNFVLLFACPAVNLFDLPLLAPLIFLYVFWGRHFHERRRAHSA